ncbi:MAG: hypothetical protein RQ723_08355 [Desulfuromonadales bacterium]|nr:hypothetical protein [Desulfuromonadales bacterium]
MNRFRFTLLAVCAVLLLLGGSDLATWIKNQQPVRIAIADLEFQDPPQAWLQVTGGFLDLNDAISTSGTIELEALLVPLRPTPDSRVTRVLVETRDPHLLELFKQYHFFSDTLPEKKAFFEQHRHEFLTQRNVTGMLVSGLISQGNEQKLLKLATETDLELVDGVIFLSEGKEPARWRGVFFAVVGLLGLVRVLTSRKPAGRQDAAGA